MLVHIGSVPIDLLNGWAREYPPFGAAMPLTSPNIIGIEEVSIRGMRRSIARRGRGQNKGFEKPTRMRQMPLRGAHIRHGLNDIIFSQQGLTETHSELSYLFVTPDKGLLVGCLTRNGGDSRVMDTLSHRHVPLLFRVVFDLDTQRLYNRRAAWYTLD
jgi:hypothetical protein